jgi:hypothetical protein
LPANAKQQLMPRIAGETALCCAFTGREGFGMAKGQAKSNKEIRKPKAEKPKKQNASNPSTK